MSDIPKYELSSVSTNGFKAMLSDVIVYNYMVMEGEAGLLKLLEELGSDIHPAIYGVILDGDASKQQKRISLSVVRGVNRAIRSHLATLSCTYFGALISSATLCSPVILTAPLSGL